MSVFVGELVTSRERIPRQDDHEEIAQAFTHYFLYISYNEKSGTIGINTKITDVHV